MHAPAPELAALRKLAEKHQSQFEKLLEAELKAIGAAPVVDKNGKVFELDDKALTRDDVRVTITRIDIRSKRVVVTHADGTKQLLMAHRLEQLPPKSKRGKAGTAPVAAAKQADAAETAMDAGEPVEDVQPAEAELETAS